MREIDRLTSERYATPSLLLMEAAAQSAARHIAAHFSHDLTDKKALVLCGRGNNGGDGAALARALWTAGAHADVILFGRVADTTGDARTNFEIARRLASFEAGSKLQPSPLFFVECESIEHWEKLASGRKNYDVIVDALFGTGLTRPLEGVFLQVVEHLALVRAARDHAGDAQPLVVSLDLASGLNADSAEVSGLAVRADLTVTFTAPKVANVLPPASHHNGQLVTAHIGSPPALTDAAPSRLFLSDTHDARRWLRQTRYSPDSYKNTHGHVLVVAGSRRMSGAAVLCGDAAMRAGAGLVTVASPASAVPAVAARLMPEVMTAELAETDGGSVSDAALEQALRLTERATVVALGCGLSSDDEATRKFVRAFVEQRDKPLVLDADGLNALAPWPAELRGSKSAPLIITPHEGEMLRLLGMTNDRDALMRDRVRAVREFASAHDLIVVLKGTRTLVAAPDGRVFVNATGNAGLGTAGSGDTLTGVIAAFNAQAFATLGDEADALTATLAAVFVAGLAGDLAARALGMRAMTASDIRDYLSAAVLSLDAEGELP